MIADPLPDWLNQEAWAAFIHMRKMKGKSYPFTPKAQERILQRLAAFHALGQNTTDILWKSHDRGWSDVFAQPVQVVPVINPEAATPEYKKTQAWIAAQAAHKANPCDESKVRAAQEAMARIKQTIRSK